MGLLTPQRQDPNPQGSNRKRLGRQTCAGPTLPHPRKGSGQGNHAPPPPGTQKEGAGDRRCTAPITGPCEAASVWPEELDTPDWDGGREWRQALRPARLDRRALNSLGFETPETPHGWGLKKEFQTSQVGDMSLGFAVRSQSTQAWKTERESREKQGQPLQLPLQPAPSVGGNGGAEPLAQPLPAQNFEQVADDHPVKESKFLNVPRNTQKTA